MHLSLLKRFPQRTAQWEKRGQSPFYVQPKRCGTGWMLELIYLDIVVPLGLSQERKHLLLIMCGLSPQIMSLGLLRTHICQTQPSLLSYIIHVCPPLKFPLPLIALHTRMFFFLVNQGKHVHIPTQCHAKQCMNSPDHLLKVVISQPGLLGVWKSPEWIVAKWIFVVGFWDSFSKFCLTKEETLSVCLTTF